MENVTPNAPPFTPVWAIDERFLNRMKYESERLATFGRNWPIDFIDPVDLARAGFFYHGGDDKVMCTFCLGVLSGWRSGDMPYMRHVTNFPRCPFILCKNVGNVPNGGDVCGSSRDQPPRCVDTSRPCGNNCRTSSLILQSPGENLLQPPENHGRSSSSILQPRGENVLQPPESNERPPSFILQSTGQNALQPPDSYERLSSSILQSPGENVQQPPENNERLPSSILQSTGENALQPPDSYDRLSSSILQSPGENVLQPPENNERLQSLSLQSPSEIVLHILSLLSPGENVLEVIEINDRPTSSMLSHSENVLHVRGGDALSTGVMAYRGPRHPSFASKAARLKSFLHWPSSAHVKFEDLAEAGFFYLGTEDKTMCFHCGGGLGNWENGDVPWYEHFRWYPDCNYVQLRNLHRPIVPNTPANVTATANVIPKSATETGIPNVTAKTENVIVNLPPTSEEDPNFVRLEEELRQMKEMKMCKICMDRELQVVCVPCGHLVACIQCTAALENCALCRTPIEGIIRTFLP